MGSIPEEDLKDINSALSTSQGDTITKDRSGKIIKKESGIVNSKGFLIKDYSGKTLRRAKHYFDNGVQKAACQSGDKYDSIPAHIKQRVQFTDEDFE